jgi:hypothetical protein
VVNLFPDIGDPDAEMRARRNNPQSSA